MFELMKGHQYEDAWDNDEFNRLFDLFQEDAPDGTNTGGLDKNEFRKFIIRISEL